MRMEWLCFVIELDETERVKYLKGLTFERNTTFVIIVQVVLCNIKYVAAEVIDRALHTTVHPSFLLILFVDK